jgi:hypothetical protein
MFSTLREMRWTGHAKCKRKMVNEYWAQLIHEPVLIKHKHLLQILQITCNKCVTKKKFLIVKPQGNRTDHLKDLGIHQ